MRRNGLLKIISTRSHEERTIVMEYTMGLPTPKFADLLIRLREERVEGYPPSMGLRDSPRAALIPRAPQHSAGGDRRAAGCVPAHDLAGHWGHDRCDRPGPEGTCCSPRRRCPRAATSAWAAPSSPAGVGGITANYGRGEHGTTGMNVQILILPNGRLVRASDPYPGSMHDAAALNASGLLDGIDPSGWIADKGYIGRGMITPQQEAPQRRTERSGRRANKSINRIRQAERADHRPHQVLENPPAPTTAAPCTCTHSSMPSPTHSHSTSSRTPHE